MFCKKNSQQQKINENQIKKAFKVSIKIDKHKNYYTDYK